MFKSKHVRWLSNSSDKFTRSPTAMHTIVYSLRASRGMGSLRYSNSLEPLRELDGGGGQPPVKSEARAQSNKVGRLWFLGGRCSRISGGTPEARSRLCVCRAPFLMTFVTSGMSLAGSRHLPLFYFLKQPDVAQSRASECSAEES